MQEVYLKVEERTENYLDIQPPFTKKKRLKVGTFKVDLNGYKLGERFIKIIFDNALQYKVEEIYVTIFDKRPEQIRLINLFEEFGFKKYGDKNGELVYVRDMNKIIDTSLFNNNPINFYPFIDKKNDIYLVPIHPEYHTKLLPDSILNNENPSNFSGNESFSNSVKKVYISHSYERNMKKGDILIFYRTGGYHRSVITTIGIIEEIIININSERDFINFCKNRSVFSEQELIINWNKYKDYKPFIVKFLYSYSFPKRLNLAKLIELKIIKDVSSAPRGFTKITKEQFDIVNKEVGIDESYLIN